jgi:integrase
MNMASAFKRGKTWVASYKGEDGLWHSKAAGTDKGAALELARREETIAMRRREGLIDPNEERFAVQAKQGIADHVTDFIADLKAKGRGVKHYALTETRVRRVLTLAKIETLAHLQASRINSALGMLRDGLAVDSERIVKAVSKASVLHYTRAVKMFTRWLERDNRCRSDVLKSIKVGTVQKSERVQIRRALSREEFSALVVHVEKAGAVFGMGGGDRSMLYRVAAGTGLRAGELASLTPQSFILTEEECVVCVKAAYSKRKRDDRQPVPADLAEMLKTWLEGKARLKPVFAMPQITHLAEMMRKDLRFARARWLRQALSFKERRERRKSAFLCYRDESGAVLEFHALRHS